ncbi:MAG: carbon storage regulator CsrA [Syntrophomonadaceae bacterium]|nr:carbon storage regulator CsrA [Syntrophomonadaceae bacterium]
MLVLTRKIDEGIVIGDNITIRVIAVEGNKVKLGIIADKDISIVREEILEAVKNENLSAGHIDGSILNWSIIPPSEQK